MGWFCPRCGHQAGTEGTCPRDGELLLRVSSFDLLGRQVGEYLILAMLGGGSYGSVYRAVHERSGMMVAIKLLHRPIDDVESQRVIVEARAAAMLNHPHVVQVYDLAMTTDRRPYIVMQLLDGKPLSAVIRQGMEVRTAVAIANDVLAALGVAHARGVIHRDLKPDNIFITKGHALIVDFGLAKLIADPRSPSLTATGDALGTPAYMAPEQIRGEIADGRADLYALGGVLFEMLAGRPPFEGNATYAVFDAHLHKPPPSITTLRPDVPPAIDAAIARALAKSPGARFATAADMQRALVSVPPRRSNKRLAIAATVAIAGLATVGIVVAARGTSEPTAITDGSASPPPGPRRIEVPPALPDEAPLEPKLEDALRSTADMVSRGHLTRADLVRMRCGMQQPLPDGAPAYLKTYTRRLVALLHAAQPDLDVAKDCKAAPKRFSRPEPLPDEGKDTHIDQMIDAVHDQLDADRMTFKQASDMACDFTRQRDDEIARTGSLHRTMRSMHRRIAILLEAYHPGSTKVRCQ
jgi:serine/threonine protein kinase